MARRLLALLAAAAAVLTLAGCGSLRLESEGPTADPPDPQQQLRQQLAVQTEQLSGLAAYAGQAADGDVAALLAALVADLDVQLASLGGVWRPSSRHLEPATPRGDAADVLAGLQESAVAVEDAAIVSDGELAQLYAGLAVSRSLRADQLAVALGGQPGVVEPALPTALDPTTSADLVRTLDALGEAWEVVAARSDGDVRAAAADTAAGWREQAQAVAALAGVADTPDDPREVSYDLDTTDLDATSAGLQADLMPSWLVQVSTTTGDDRRAVIALALTAGREAGLSDAGATPPPIAGFG